MEDDRDRDEEAEDEDLQEQAAQDDVLAQLHFGRVAGRLDAAAAALDEECEDVAGDEELREPGDADDEIGLCVGGADEPA